MQWLKLLSQLERIVPCSLYEVMEVVTNTEGSLVGENDNSEQKIQKSWRKKLLGFLASYVGLFIYFNSIFFF